MQANTPNGGDGPTHEVMTVDPHDITPDMLAVLGLGQIAYIRAETTPDGRPATAIRAADGDILGFAQNEAVARAAALQHDLDALSVH